MEDQKPRPNLRIVHSREHSTAQASAPTQTEPTSALLLECLFRSTEQPRIYPVAPAEQGRIENVLNSKDKVFLALETMDGRAVYLNTDHIQWCRMGVVPYSVEKSELGHFLCQMLGGDELRLDVDDGDFPEMPLINLVLDTHGEVDDQFVMVPDEAGSTWALNMADILYVEFPTLWHILGSEAMEEEERAAERRRKPKKRKPRRPTAS